MKLMKNKAICRRVLGLAFSGHGVIPGGLREFLRGGDGEEGMGLGAGVHHHR